MPNATPVPCKRPGCLGRVLWCESVNGKPMPVDPIPHVDGDLELILDEDRQVLVAHVRTGLFLAQCRDEGTRLYRHHGATCGDRPAA